MRKILPNNSGHLHKMAARIVGRSFRLVADGSLEAQLASDGKDYRFPATQQLYNDKMADVLPSDEKTKKNIKYIKKDEGVVNLF